LLLFSTPKECHTVTRAAVVVFAEGKKLCREFLILTSSNLLLMLLSPVGRGPHSHRDYYYLTIAGCLGVLTSLYYLRLRKKPNTLQYETRIRTRDRSSLQRDNCDDDNENFVKDDERDENDQINIGFGTDPSWFHQEPENLSNSSKSKKCDILHTGNRSGGKLIIAMVGLPGSGKTFMSRKISRFLRWVSYRTRVYSLAKYRLEKFGAMNADFFDPENEKNSQTRVRNSLIFISSFY
jgi:hypothetical protein